MSNLKEQEEAQLESLLDTHGLKMLAGMAIGSALAGSYAAGEPVKIVLTALQGSAGLVAGFAAGTLAQVPLIKSAPNGVKLHSQTPSIVYYMPWIGAALIPIVAGGAFDRELIALLGGAWAGAYFAGRL